MSEPVWIDRETARVSLGVPVRVLDELVDVGAVRSLKYGSCKQSARRYFRPDLENALLSLAEGREPGRPRRKVSRREPAEVATVSV